MLKFASFTIIETFSTISLNQYDLHVQLKLLLVVATLNIIYNLILLNWYFFYIENLINNKQIIMDGIQNLKY
jgi:hypothetical protein